MRISDWSSYVCSSDLRPPPATGPPSAQPLEGPMLAAYLQLAGAMILAGATVAAAKPVVAVLTVYVFGALRFAIDAARSEERRVGNECVSTCSSRWSPSHYIIHKSPIPKTLIHI